MTKSCRGRRRPLWVKSGGRAFACGRSDLPFIADLLTPATPTIRAPIRSPIEFFGTPHNARLASAKSAVALSLVVEGTTRKFPKCWQPSALVKWSAGSERRTMKAPKPKQWAEQEVRRLVRLARQGVGVSRIAAELGRHAGSVRRMARTMGILLKK
ncbi:bll4620 [Bradyrhizobium diazoefficiens USDA 110]|uniref:Bll4620 protein n=1 Tax=Bradyrhizobium diazoefficiens (strain JCM 10833 / BCRC 13528 / IAM 13628 / NBRC 14792 / USDA 110) TaxID=224911 RepID=Q89LC5_BRADU|nr:helix-turn-helix domain containing protein [Bradyrhizobium diazoefficiens]QBP23395.1 helix-turn-helix domain containing protein [Bradyrhizobium diazoefficiens]BAC49885.1 bll4620 [Bradyrhizobium diazoefficiens USDA 110]